MQKEIRVEEKGIELCFFYDDRSVTKVELGKLKKVLKLFLIGLASKQKTFLGRRFKKLSLNLNLCGIYKIKKLNFEFRRKNKPTDVLSFPLQENIRNDDFELFQDPLELGDIFICKQVCERQSHQYKISFEDEFLHLLIHGFLHLSGYDHELNEKEDILMRRLEENFIDDISKLKKR